MVQIILQNLQGLDIQVIGRFIQDQDIGILHQDTEQTQPPLFAAGQLADRRVLHFRIKKELLAHGRSADQPVLCAYIFSRLPNEINDPQAVIRHVVLLGKITDLHSLSDGHPAFIRHCLPCNTAEQGRFAAAVGPDDADPVRFAEKIGKVSEKPPVPIAFSDPFDLDDRIAQPGRERSQLHLPVLRDLFPVPESFEAADMGLLLGRPGPRPPHHPGQILFIKLGHPAFCRQGIIQSLLLHLQILGVTAVIAESAAPVQFNGLIGDRVQKIAVMGDQQQGFLPVLQIFLQPGHHTQVQMVGRLIQDQQVTGRKQSGRQSRPLLLAARQMAGTAGGIIDSQTQQHIPHPSFRIPVFLPVPGPVRYIIQQALPLIKDRFLGQAGDPKPRPRDDLPLIRLLSSGDDGKKGGFTGPVDPDDPDPVPVLNPDRNIRQDGPGDIALADMFQI